MDKLQFQGGNPGAVHLGNFINYYKFNPPESRAQLLPDFIFESSHPITALDIGCNAGDLTQVLYEQLSNRIENQISILAIDIDPILIERASEKVTSQNITYLCCDIMNEESDSTLSNYLENKNMSRFDITFCFSITMWIHLNHGDEGLRKFINKVCALSRTIVIEPQPWKCYKSAVKRLKLQNEEFQHFEDLKLCRDREQDIVDLVLSNNSHSLVYESSQTKWERKILIFTT